MQAVNLAGEGDWSPSRKFSTLITGVNLTVDEGNGLVVYPNPTTGKFRIISSEFTVERAEVVNLSRKVMEIFEVQHETGFPEFDIDHLPGFIFCGYSPIIK